MADKARLKLGDVHLTNSNTGPLPDGHSTALQQRKQSSLNLVMLRLYQTWKLQFLKVLWGSQLGREILIKLLIVCPVSELVKQSLAMLMYLRTCAGPQPWCQDSPAVSEPDEIQIRKDIRWIHEQYEYISNSKSNGGIGNPNLSPEQYL